MVFAPKTASLVPPPNAGKPSFVAYIDESGDEGFKWTGKGGSSAWFVLTAVVLPVSKEPIMREAMASSRSRLKKTTTNPPASLHFADLRHEQCVVWAEEIAKSEAKTISICCHKPDLKKSDFLREKSRLYFYMIRFIVERTSWACRDWGHTNLPGEDGTIEFIFSNRSSMKYDEVKSYIEWITANPECRIVRARIGNQCRIRSIQHHLRDGLQVADLIAGSWAKAIEVSHFGIVEPRYSQILLPLAYRHNERIKTYGLKIFPPDSDLKFWSSPKYEWIK